MKTKHLRDQNRREALDKVLLAYLGDRYQAEDGVLFQQINLREPSVDSMFVDVPIGCRRDGSPIAALMDELAHEAPGDTADLERESNLGITGATQLLLNPRWTGCAVIVGGPGQGKSTVLQFVCQFHRARRLTYSTYKGDHFDTPAEHLARFPIRIDLRRYAQWALTPPKQVKKRKKGRTQPAGAADGQEPWESLERYLIDHIQSHIGAHHFGPTELAVLLNTEPVLLAFDGLDEVASVDTRARVVDEIAQLRGRLQPNSADLVILVATRPGSSLQPLTRTGHFPVLHLQRLTQGLRLQYLQKWATSFALSPDATANLQATFMDNQHVPHIDELASYPMQLAILLHLLYRRQLLPERRTDLYAEYFQAFLDREQADNKEPLLARQRKIVEDTHDFLGWYLQAKAEQGNSSGAITREELLPLLRAHLAGQPHELELVDQLYSALTDRVLCLVEREDAFEFEVQSLREYFAARYLFDNLNPRGDGNSRDDGLNALLERPYWSNVCRFFIGMLSKGEVRGLRGNFEVIGKRFERHPMMQAMAVTVLKDQIYLGQNDAYVQQIVDLVLDDSGLIIAQDGLLEASGSPLQFTAGAGRDQAVDHLKRRLELEHHPEIRHAAAHSLLAHSLPDDELANWWWDRFESTSSWLHTASDLGAFANLGIDRTDLLVSALSELSAEPWWLTEILIDGRYDGSDERILTLATADLNAGAAEVVRRRGSSSSLEKRAEATSSALASRSPFSQDQDRSRHWGEHLVSVADTWGDGWMLRRAVSAVPGDADLVSIADHSQNQAGDAVRDECAYRQHRSDPSWWRQMLQPTAGSSWPRLLVLIALFQHARPSVIVELAVEVDNLVNGLSRKEYRVVETSMVHDVANHRIRSLDLQDALRTGQIAWAGRTLWLAYIAGTTATRERIATRLTDKLDDVFEAGTTDGRQVVVSSRSQRKIDVKIFANARRVLAAGGWVDRVDLKVMTQNTAKIVLSGPENWPPDVVEMAVDLTSAQVTRNMPALSQVAATSRWF